MGLSLKQWRLAKEISQEKMAAACGVHRNTYGRLGRKSRMIFLLEMQRS